MTRRQRLISNLIWIGIFQVGYWTYWVWSETFSQVLVAGTLVVAIMASRLYEQRVSEPLLL